MARSLSTLLRVAPGTQFTYFTCEYKSTKTDFRSALSATVGEPEQFVEWLQAIKDTQKLADAGRKRESYKVTLTY